MMSNNFVKVYVDLPNHWAIGGESMWASVLENGTYRIENIPFYAYGLNYHDVVSAETSIEQRPAVNQILTPSGHRTLRFLFNSKTEPLVRESILASLQSAVVSYEGQNESYYALDIAPTGDYNAVYDRLEVLTNEGILEFETCEAKAIGSFDDLPK